MNPANPHRKALVLQVVASDNTFSKASLGGRVVWLGKCLHCRAKLVVNEDGSTPVGTTVEHIVPQHHGGGNDLRNLALACSRCNNLKGKRIDPLAADDARYQQVIERPQKARDQRYR